MKLHFSNDFLHSYRKLKDRSLQGRIRKALRKIESNPKCGKPLRYGFKGHRCIVVPPHRIIYRLDGNRLIMSCFEHRGKVYRKAPAS